MAELSRGELLAWVNDLTNLNLPKVESLGTGAAHCLIIHSIFGDVPNPSVPSVTSLFPSGNWSERETFDLFS